MTEKMASKTYVDNEIQREIGTKEFTPINHRGDFMLPVFKGADDVQRYMKLSIVSIDGVWCPDLDQNFYIKDENGEFVEVNQ